MGVKDYNIEMIKDWVNEYPFLNEIGDLQYLIYSFLNKESLGAWGLEEIIKNKRGIDENYQQKNFALSGEILTGEFYRKNSDLLKKLINFVSKASLPLPFGEECKNLSNYLSEKPERVRQLMELVLGRRGRPPEDFNASNLQLGLVNYFLWHLLRETLKPLRDYLNTLEEEMSWGENYCPLCGEQPSMGQLIRTKKGRERVLSCSLCQTTWKYKRLGCPYCKNDEQESLNIIELRDNPIFRLDTCGKCFGYLKTYLDEGKERIALDDWSTLHLDVIAESAGFQRKDTQLYRI